MRDVSRHLGQPDEGGPTRRSIRRALARLLDIGAVIYVGPAVVSRFDVWVSAVAWRPGAVEVADSVNLEEM